MGRLNLLVICFSFLVFNTTNAARILCVFPTPSISHQIVYRVLTQALARRGHEVVVITTHPAFPPKQAPANLTEIDIPHEAPHMWNSEVAKFYNEKSDEFNINKMYLKLFTNIFEKQIQMKPVQDLIRNRSNFELLLLESNIVDTLGLSHVFNAPVIQTSTFGPTPGTYSLFGAANNPLLYPTAIHLKMYNLTMWESLINLYKSAVFEYVAYSHKREVNEMLRRNLGSDIPPMTELIDKVSLFMQSVYPSWMNSPPVPHNIVYLGGLHQTSAKDLPEDLQKFLDSSKNGAIYVSFGTSVKTSLLSSEKIEIMERVLSKLPYDVLWKRDDLVQINGTDNIKIATWFPQSDLLYHPKIKLFITQGGLQSTEEAITAGVPLIGMPIFADQFHNTEKYGYHRIGMRLDWSTLSEDELNRSIETVIENESYKNNIMHLRSVFADQPVPAVERAIWWTEYVLRHGGARHLLPASANMPWTQYYEVELVLIVLAAILSALITVGFASIKTLRWLCNRTYKRHVEMY